MHSVRQPGVQAHRGLALAPLPAGGSLMPPAASPAACLRSIWNARTPTGRRAGRGCRGRWVGSGLLPRLAATLRLQAAIILITLLSKG